MKKNSAIIWITGLSGSGKTTIAKILINKIKKIQSRSIHIDGDELRECASTIIKKNSFSSKQRENIGLFYSKLSKKISEQGFIVITSVMALQKKVHEWNIKNNDNFYDIYLNVPIKELKKRDPKKIYSNFQKGIFKNLYGLDLKYDKPEKPWLDIKWKKNLNKYVIANIIFKKIVSELKLNVNINNKNFNKI